MVFSQRNNPVFNCIEKNSLGEMPVFEVDKEFFDLYMENFTKNWKYYNLRHFNKEINVVSESFYNASSKASKKLADLYNDIMTNDTEDFSISGTFLIGDLVYMIYFDTKKGNDGIELAFYVFHKKGMPIACWEESFINNVSNAWISNNFTHEIEKNEESIRKWLNQKMTNVIVISMFKKYAEVETKIIYGESKIDGKKGEKIINSLKSNITYLDSKWFTNIVKSDSFKVSGHFRLQPKKNESGEWTKEIIWINDFEKSGYTSKAKISN